MKRYRLTIEFLVDTEDEKTDLIKRAHALIEFGTPRDAFDAQGVEVVRDTVTVDASEVTP